MTPTKSGRADRDLLRGGVDLPCTRDSRKWSGGLPHRPIMRLALREAEHQPTRYRRRTTEGSGTVAERTKYILDESEMPTTWYNVVPDLPQPPPPPLHPGTHQPVGPDDLAPLFPMALIGQRSPGTATSTSPVRCSTSTPCGVQPPLYQAHRLEKALDTPARIYFKYEGVSPAGSHKPNTAGAPGYYNAEEGIKRITTETGAGQWGSALALACSIFGLGCEVWQRTPRSTRSHTAGDDGDLGGHRPSQPFGTHRGGTQDPGRETPTAPAASASPSRRRSRQRWATRRRTTPLGACSTTC